MVKEKKKIMKCHITYDILYNILGITMMNKSIIELVWNNEKTYFTKLCNSICNLSVIYKEKKKDSLLVHQ